MTKPQVAPTFVLRNEEVFVRGSIKPRTERQALAWSIKKWKFIVACLTSGKLVRRDGGLATCACCALYYHNYGYEAGRNCLECPVYKGTRRPFCEGTPYTRWESYSGKLGNLSITKLQIMAKRELAFLQSLKTTRKS